MGTSRLVLRSLLVTGAAIAVTAVGSMSASAAPASTPSASPSCKVPALTLSATTAMPGTKITVSGKNFSGCTAAGSTVKPTAVIAVKVGVVTATNVQDLLATTKTGADGSFSVQITIPKVPAGGKPEIAVAAVSEDPATKLVYHATDPITYSVPPTTPAPTTSASPAPPTTAPTSATPAPTATSSSPDVPTAVPAGTGGMGGTTGPTQIALELGLGAAGLALLGAGGITVARRRTRLH